MEANTYLEEKPIAEELNPGERARILRKLDWHLLPFVSLLYLLSFLDRANIGNAKVAGMSVDLDLIGYRYNIAAAVFFILYSFAEVPSNIALKLFRPSRWSMVTSGFSSLPPTNISKRIAIFFSAATVAGAFGGLLA
ncbi:hypothetical protein AZE42_02473 [Rhizopogon vesiculosus]|uniref:Major facilitator superfamily (MFS) profile domain-containing protein n=1 Tax=Rhizopogon vesiculosus TaxID=180088 RepID=A0A1J8QHE7_9AGAM|nr:hypothetical protein AZE42_02473 [Rhizopogon vesiculosus]